LSFSTILTPEKLVPWYITKVIHPLVLVAILSILVLARQ
jgi:hypothetical protein